MLHVNLLIKRLLHLHIKFGYCVPDTPSTEILFIEADENLFRKVLRNSHHTLYPLLPPPADRTFNLRQRKHNRSLIPKAAHSAKILLYDCSTETYTDGNAVLIFALFFFKRFSLLALTFVAVTLFRSLYKCDVVSWCAMSQWYLVKSTLLYTTLHFKTFSYAAF